jgi:RNA polymerase sigma factor (sigma-70 family)
MDQGKGGGWGNGAAEEFVLRMVAAHASSLLRTARRYSLCADDAQDAYQRTLELLMANADRLDPSRAAGWLHVVVKREAQAICRSRTRLLSASEVDPDSHDVSGSPSTEERVLCQELVSRSAEALQRLKPQELRALWLKAEGYSYNEIASLTGWSYTKVNRCLTEGRRSFLLRFAAIESGAECDRWLPLISAIVDGEATPEQLLELRPHLRNCSACRGTLKALQDSSVPLSVILPVPLALIAGDGGERLAHAVARIYEFVAAGWQERAVYSVTKAQAAFEAATTGKVAAVAASAAVAAGSGYATVERTVTRDRAASTRQTARHDFRSRKPQSKPRGTVAPAQVPRVPLLSERRVTPSARKVAKAVASATPSQEFDPTGGSSAGSGADSHRGAPATSVTSMHETPTSSKPPTRTAVEYAATSSSEFGP